MKAEDWLELPISIHTPHAGSDLTYAGNMAGATGFQSTLPMRGATYFLDYYKKRYQFQSTLPMRGATNGAVDVQFIGGISIHTPHAGSDGGFHRTNKRRSISIHTPHAGSDEQALSIFLFAISFQSTLPMRGATLNHFNNGINI